MKRIKEIANQEGVSVTALEASIGASKGVFSRALANGTDIQSKWLVKLAENYPQYSPQWLLTGEGEMRKADVLRDLEEKYASGHSTDLTNELIKALKKVISSQETTIQSQAATITALQKRIGELENGK
ncbi:hypothetical protein [Parapedobacter composti]|uniref:hypothetical protein n=1 Tax=Parapedobacter composti TaxID=623281 RepID=UPI001113969A|nr:hypothetical protein [Parapedobacter composti]